MTALSMYVLQWYWTGTFGMNHMGVLQWAHDERLMCLNSDVVLCCCQIVVGTWAQTFISLQQLRRDWIGSFSCGRNLKIGT